MMTTMDRRIRRRRHLVRRSRIARQLGSYVPMADIVVRVITYTIWYYAKRRFRV